MPKKCAILTLPAIIHLHAITDITARIRCKRSRILPAATGSFSTTCLDEVSPKGQYKPWLAESWEMAQDGRSWHLTLHKGVPFQHGYGEFTAKDVVHNHALWCDDHYPGRQDPPFSGYRNGMCMVHRMEVLNDHELVMHCKNVCLDVLFYYSSASNMPMFRKAQWDHEGEMGYEKQRAGAGPDVV